MKKRVLILILMAAMILTLLPITTAMAEDPDSHLPFAVTGGTYGANWTYDWNGTYGTLHITYPSTFSLKVAMKEGVTQTSDRIVIDDPGLGYAQHVLLDGVNIDVSGVLGACAAEVRPSYDSSGTNSHFVTISCKGTNILKSGYGAPGIRVPENTLVYFDNSLSGVSGSLEATGGTSSPGIGGQPGENNGHLRFNSGSFTANGGSGAPGIGSGAGASSVGVLNIYGGSVYASGGSGATDTGSVFLNSTSAQFFARHDNCPWVNTTTHTHKTFTGANAGDTVFGGVTLPWSGDYGAYLPLCTLSYNANGGSGTLPDPVEIVKGISASVTIADSSGLSREHYTFTGWNTDPNGGGTAYAPGATPSIAFNNNITLYAQWLGDGYTVTFDAQGGTVSTGQKSVIYGSSYGELPTPERTDYLFGGWYTEPGGAGTLISSDTIFVNTSNQTLYAKWFANACTVTFNAQGGTMSPGSPGSKVVAYGNAYGELPVPVRSGYKFFGWFLQADGTGGQITADSIVSTDQDHTLYAKWANSFTVTFDAQGGTPAVQTKTVKLNCTMTAPIAPTRSGYSFKGWYREPECINVWNFTTNKVADNITLYAKWAPKIYTVTFNSRGGSAVHYANVVYDTLVTKPANPSRYGYKFDDWYKDSACTNAWAFDTDHMPAKNITLYAKWNIHQWNVTFDAKGGEFEPGVTTLVRNGVAYYSLIPAPLIPTRTHYTFKGWYKNETYTSPWYFYTSRTPDRDLTLYVKWQPDAFKITFNSQGGTKVYSKTGYWDKPIAKPANPTRTGYTFGGWFKDADCTDDWVFGTGGDVVTGAVTLYAKWTPKIYTVTFNPSGGTIGGNPTYSETKNYGETISRPTMTLEKGVYYFGGWYTSKYFTTQWNFGKPVTKSMTLYAKWMTSKYKITFKANASGVSNLPVPIYAICYEMPLEPPQPTKTSYIFGGWYRSSTYFTEANRYHFDGGFVTGSVTLYARWIPAQYKVSFNAMGGTPTPLSQTIDWDRNAIEPAAPTKTGYFFGGWYTSSTYFTDKYKWDFDSKTVTKNMTLYARWVKTLSTPKVTAVAGNVAAIMLRCSTVPFAKYYKFEYAASALGLWTPLYDGEFSEIGAGDMDINTVYYFRAKAYCIVNGVIFSSGYSPVVPETPDKPGSVTATAASYNKIHVAWSDSGIYRNTGYEVWRATSLKGTYTKLGTTASAVLSLDNTVYTGKKYYYKVRAYRYVGTKVYGAFSDIVSKNTILEVPGSFIAGGSSATSATAVWNAVDGASGYELWRATAVTGVFRLLKCTTALSYKNTGLVTNQPYYYKVRAYRYVLGRKVYSYFTDVKTATPSDF